MSLKYSTFQSLKERLQLFFSYTMQQQQRTGYISHLCCQTSFCFKAVYQHC